LAKIGFYLVVARPSGKVAQKLTGARIVGQIVLDLSPAGNVNGLDPSKSG
jgi:hypothetical protein